MFVALGRMPEHPEARAVAARIAGLALADASRLLAGPLPRILLRATDDGAAKVAALEAEGFVAWTGEPSAVPTDAQRVLVRGLAWTEDGFIAQDAAGQPHACPFAALRLLQRGARTHTSTTVETTKETKFDAGKALLSGGLVLTKTVERTTQRTTEAKEPFLLLQRSDGAPDLMIAERRMNYACLGTEMTQATLANLGLLAKRFQARCPMDDRVGRPGFVAGLPLLPVDAVDLALHLVSEAAKRGC